MFDRPHHQRIVRLLSAFDRDLLREAECYFGGGTAIVLTLTEYRESVDIDFLCGSASGYRLLRNTVTEQSLGALLREPVEYVRNVRTDRDKISTFLRVEETPIKVEFVRESRIPISGVEVSSLPVTVLAREDMYAEKILANADRGLDRSVMSRDLIDLSMMLANWGPAPDAAWQKAIAAYGREAVRKVEQGRRLLEDREYLARCLDSMQMAPELLDDIPSRIDQLVEQGERAIELIAAEFDQSSHTPSP